MTTAPILLSTKLFTPALHPQLVARVRVRQFLDRGMQAGVILVSAPAGFGKTTAVVDWLHQPKPMATPALATCCWLALDEHDNDPMRFLSYLLATLQQVDAAIGGPAQMLLQTAQPPPLETLITILINSLNTVATQATLVLDDYHTITTPVIHQAMTFLIDHLPPSLRLVIISRSDPPWPLARWRVRQALVELRAHQLRFTAEETAAFLQEALQISLSAAQVRALERRTEGWVAALQLVALSLQGAVDADAFIQRCTGNHTYIVDYLIEEVLHRQPAVIQQFLRQTAILERLSAPLCNAVTGRDDSQMLLEQLHRANLFLLPLDDTRQWYRYHHLFAEVLQNRLRQEEAEQIAAYHRRAGRWYAAAGELTTATVHTFLGQDLDYAAALLLQSAEPLLARGESVTLVKLLAQLPPGHFDAYPPLRLAYAKALILQHRVAEAEASLVALEQIFAAKAAHADGASLAMQSEVTGALADIALNRGRVAEAVVLAQRTLATAAADQALLRGQTFLLLGVAYQWQAHYGAAQSAYEAAIAIGNRYHLPIIRVFAATALGRTYFIQGKARAAAALMQQTMQWATEQGVDALPFMASACIALGEIYYEWDQRAAAATQVADGLQRAEAAHNPRSLCRGYTLRLRLATAAGDSTAAHAVITCADALLRQHDLPPAQQELWLIALVRWWLQQGQSQRAAAWLQERQWQPDAPVTPGTEAISCLYARILIGQDKPVAALAVLAQVQDAVIEQGDNFCLLETLLLTSLAQTAIGEEVQSYTTLQRALILAEPERYLRIFLDEGEPMHLLLTKFRDWLSGQRTDPQGTPLWVYLNYLLSTFANLLLPAKEISISEPVMVGASPCGRPQGDAPTITGFGRENSLEQPSAMSVTAAPVANGTVRTRVAPLVEPLSEREREVLRLVAAGLSNQQIAAKLIITVGTVKRHLNNIFGKLQVTSRTQAIVRASALDLL